MDTDVLIVGGGPVGVMLACELQRRGVRHRIVDARPAVDYYCKALGVTPRTLEIFDQIGVLDEAVSRGVWLKALSTTVNHEVVARVLTQHERWPYGPISLAQYDTEEVLEACLHEHGGRVERGCTVTEVTEGPDAVVSRLADGRTITSRYVVGCDGAHSTVRKAAGLGFDGGRYPMVFVLGDVDIEWDRPHDEAFKMARVVDGETRNFTVVVPIAGSPRRYRISMAAPPAYWGEDAVLPDPIPLDLLMQFVGDNLPPGTKVTNLRWSSMYRISHRLASAYRKGRLFVAGDAAHIHPPIGGLGMNTGLQDAFNLGWKLERVLRHGAAETLLDTYHEERHRVGEEVVGLTARRMDDAIENKPTDTQHETAEEDANTQLHVSYRGSSLCGGAVPDGGRGPAPGDRMAFIDGLRRAHIHRDMRFIDLLRGGRFVLLLHGGASTSIGDEARALLGDSVRVWQVAADDSETVPTLLDPHGSVTTALGPGQGAVLVRPDGHVAWRGADASGLEAVARRL